MHYTQDIMLKRSSITTAFDHMTYCAWKVTKPFEHHRGNAITDSASFKYDDDQQRDFSALHKLNFVKESSLYFFIAVESNMQSHQAHCYFPRTDEVISATVPVLYSGNSTVEEEVWWMLCWSTQLCAAVLVPRISVSCAACCPPALELMPARQNKY